MVMMSGVVQMKHLCIAFIVTWSCANSGNAVSQSYQSRLDSDDHRVDKRLFDGTNCCQRESEVCKDGFIQLESKVCYFFSSKQKTWHQAQEICENIGSTLAYPMNVIENTVLVNYLWTHFKGIQGWYMGGSDWGKEGNWVWAHNKARLTYTDWIKNRPDNHQGKEHCLHYWADLWEWNDIDCNTLYPFVCQQLNKI